MFDAERFIIVIIIFLGNLAVLSSGEFIYMWLWERVAEANGRESQWRRPHVL